MTSPNILVWSFDDWLANQLREMVAERGGQLAEVRQRRAFLSHVAEKSPAVAIVQIDRDTATAELYEAIAEIRRRFPDTRLVFVSDSKAPEEEQAAWTARWLDLGACFVIFPPLTRVILEDVVSGFMD